MEIITNNKPRHLIYGYDLPAKVRSDFDYLNDEELDCSNFVRYRGQYYDLSQFMRSDSVTGWDGVAGQSYFSGVIIKIVDSDSVIIGRYYS